MTTPANASSRSWVDAIPARWSVARLKTVADYFVSSVDKVSSEGELPVRLCNYTDVYHNDLITPNMGLMETTANVEEIRRFSLRVGDVVITKDSEDWRDIAVPALVVESADDLVCGYHLAVVRPDPSRLDSAFLLRAFQSSAVNEQFRVASNGVTRFGLPKSAIGEAIVPLPSFQEQRAIVAFLDARTARLDSLVAKKRSLIERLREKRRALISRIVTRGLSHGERATVSLLSPASNWLDGIPEHWKVVALRRLVARLDQGWSPTADNSPAGEDQWGVLKLSAVREGRFVPGENKALAELPDGIAPITPARDDVLVSRANTPERVGDACVVPRDFPSLIIPDLIYRIQLASSRLLPRFLCYFLLSRAGRALIEADARGSSGSMVKLGQGHVLSWKVPQPPLAEQAAISDYLDREGARIDDVIERVESAIARLQEYRSALITAAVTGKIDVRNGKREFESAEAVA